ARFTLLHDKHPQSRLWGDATYRLAAAALEAKRYDAVKQRVAELAGANVKPDVLAHALYVDGQRAVAQQQWSEAESRLQQVAKLAPDDSLRLPAEFWVAEAAYRQNHYDDARTRFAQLTCRLEGRTETWSAMIPLRQAQLAAQQQDWPTTRTLIADIRRQ